MKFRKIISGIICMVFTLSSASILGNIVADAVNLASPVTVNATATLENGLEYKVYEDHVEITGCDRSAEGEMIIPETIEGLPVTSIGYKAFYECSALTSVTIPNSVTSIGEYAFSDCSLKSITISDSVTSIEKWTFYHCSSLTSIVIPDSVTSIGESAFSCCSSLKSITISNSVTSIWGDAFLGCSSLTAIHVDPENQHYTDIDGILFSKDQITLHQYPAGKPDQSYLIPDGVISFAYGAFNSCSSLQSIIIPDSVRTIDNYAFSVCSSLTSVTIPDSVTSIGEYAFTECSALESITILNPDCAICDNYFGRALSETAVIYGYLGSTAQAYAEKYD